MRDKTTHIVLHTAAWPGDPSIEDIRRVHVEERGFTDVGYHYVIRNDGTIEPGRNEDFIGAHCRASQMNHKSIGICMSGHGDQQPFSEAQMQALESLVNSLRDEYRIPIENVIGHREAGASKTCPGSMVDMDQVRAYIAKHDEYVGRIALDEREDEIPSSSMRRLQLAEFDPEFYMGPGQGKKKFKQTDFGRTLLAKNKPGKIIYGLAGAAASVFAGINIDPALSVITGNQTGVIPQITNIMELDIWNIILMAVAALLTLLTTRGIIKGILNDIAIELESVIKAVQDARQAESPGGKSITPEEKVLILKEADDILILLWNRIVRSRVLRFFGLDKTPTK